jgi:serine/threonine protein kinase
MKIVQDDPAPIDDKSGAIPQSLMKIVQKLLNKKPEQRFQTGKEVATALRSVVHEIDEKLQHLSESKILPLRIKWTAVMAAVVSIAMVLGSYLVYQARNDELGLLFAEYNRMADTLLKQREEHQHQVQQGVPQIVEENDNNLNDEPEQAGPESSEQASHKQVPPEKVKSEEKPAEEDDEALAAAAAEYDDATRIMPPKKNNK